MTVRVLNGYRVVDFSAMQVGPCCGVLLADFGADVIHVEPPKTGEAHRGLTTSLGISLMSPQGRQVIFEEHNRNKRGLAIDMGTSKGQEIMHRLVKTADIFLTNYRPPVVTKLRLDYEVLRELNPRLIYAQSSTFGSEGPDGGAAGIDLVAQARSGAMLASGEEGGPPVALTLGIGDRVVSIMMAYGIMSAALARERYGFGQKIETSQLASMLLLQAACWTPALVLRTAFPRHSRKHPPHNALYNYYQCKDGRWLVLAGWAEKNWPTFCNAIGKPELQFDPRFATMDLRVANRDVMVEMLDELFVTRNGDEWHRDFSAAGDFPFAVASTLTEVENDPQVIANEYVTNWDHPVLGNIKFPGYGLTLSQTPQVERKPAPELGEHNEEILLELGYDWDQIIQMRDEEII